MCDQSKILIVIFYLRVYNETVVKSYVKKEKNRYCMGPGGNTGFTLLRTFQTFIDDKRRRKNERIIIKKIEKQYQISFDEACQLFQNIRFYTHGIATYVLVDSISLSQEEVSELLKIAIKNFRNAKN